jgi:ML domain
VEAGAYVVLQVKYGLITLVKQTVDLCDQVKNVELSCPLDAGDLTIKKDVDLPKEIPPVRVIFSNPFSCICISYVSGMANNINQGQYTVLADAYTKDDEPITCLTAKIKFGLRS